MFRYCALVSVLVGIWGGCASTESTTLRLPADQEIRRKIFTIRDAILAKSAAGIVLHGTPDWSFTGPDGVTFDRAGYLARTEALFARIVVIESLETTVNRLEFPDAASADVEISQTMVRSERTPETGVVVRLKLRYRERHQWVRIGDGWRVKSVRFLGTPERAVLPAKP